MKSLAKKPVKRAASKIESRLVALEARPDIHALNPNETYLVVLPESTPQADFDAMLDALKRCPNVILVASDKLSIVRIL